MASCMIVGQISAGLYGKPWQKSQTLTWNPVANLGISKGERGIFSFHGRKLRVQRDGKTLRNSFVVYANTVPGAPVPGPPPSSGSMSWILGFVVSFILPFFTNKWGPLWVVKNRIENAVQTVENIVEAVEKVAEEVDKIAEDIAEDLPQGKLRDLVEMVEHVAEKTAKTADCLDNVIDKVQEDAEHVEDMVEAIVKHEQITTAPKQSGD